MHATDGIRRTEPAQNFGDRLPLAQVSIASLGLVLLIGLFLLSRRVSGALSAPLPPVELAVTAIVLFAWAFCARWLARASIGPVWSRLLTLCAMLVVAVACSYPGNRFVDWAVWLPSLGAFALSDRFPKIAGRPRRPGAQELASPADAHCVQFEQVVQQLTRYRSTAGQDVVRGSAAATFEAGERTSTLYVAFCPPFERLPNVEVEVVDDPSAVAKLAQVLHNGIQLEVRLTKPAQVRHSLVVEFFAAEPIDVP